MKKSLILIGGGGHCRSCIDVIQLGGKFQIDGILDLKHNVGEQVFGFHVIGTDDDIETLPPDTSFLITLGQIRSSARRQAIYERLKALKRQSPVIVSPLAYVSQHAIVGPGTIVMHHAIVNAGASVGENCIINTRALVEHDAGIGNHCHISTSAVINGGAVVGDGSFIGSGAVTRENAKIPDASFVKANSIVK
jgi:sugar O-acyltransferase (sialic acid O-acetyltransferase NeuD family)